MDATTFTQFLLRWFHFLGGITWIGLLYYFNLVNVGLMKALDGPTKTKVIPELMPRALWWFRWGAVVTWLTGFIYFAWIIVAEGGRHTSLAVWLVVWLVTYGILYFLLQNVGWWPAGKGIVLGILAAILVGAAAFAVVKLSGGALPTNRSISIAIGGGIGTIMLLNVWGIIWPHQKRIIAWTKDAGEKGTPMPPEAAQLARRAFLASRMNTWLSLPMLWFMGMASHLPLFAAVN